MADESIREVQEGIQYQGEDETIVYTIDVSNVGDGPTSPILTVKDETADFADVTATVGNGTPTVDGNIITLPAIHDLTAEKFYRCEVKFDLGGNELEHYFRIRAQR